MKLITTFVSLLVMALAAPVFAQSRVLRTPREAVVVLPQELISSPLVTGLIVEPESNAAIFSRMQPGELRLMLWNPKSQRVSILWKYLLEPGEKGTIALRGELAGHPLAVVALADRSLLIYANPLKGTAQVLLEQPGEDSFHIALSHDHQNALLTTIEGSSIKHSVVASDGKITPLSVPEKAIVRGWDQKTGQIRLSV